MTVETLRSKAVNSLDPPNSSINYLARYALQQFFKHSTLALEINFISQTFAIERFLEK